MATPETSNAPTPIALGQSPYCAELRSKRYYFLQGVPTKDSDLVDGGNYCWCRLTAQAMGPDGELVHATECKPGRECYRSLFDEEA